MSHKLLDAQPNQTSTSFRFENGSSSSSSGIVWLFTVDDVLSTGVNKIKKRKHGVRKYNYAILYDKVQLNITRLKKYLNYIEGWNEYGGLPFSAELIRIATEVIVHLHYQPHVSPTGRGTIQFDYVKGEDSLEAEIYEDKVQVLWIVKDVEEEFNISIKELPSLIDKFYAS